MVSRTTRDELGRLAERAKLHSMFLRPRKSKCLASSTNQCPVPGDFLLHQTPASLVVQDGWVGTRKAVGNVRVMVGPAGEEGGSMLTVIFVIMVSESIT